MIYAFVFIVSLYVVGYLTSNKYKSMIVGINKEVYPLKTFLPIGFLLMDLLKFKYTSNYENTIKIKLGQLSGYKNSDFYLKLFWSEKINYILFAFLFITLVGAFSETGTLFYIFSLIIVSTGWFLPDTQIQSKIKKRKQSIQIEFPEMVLKINLLISTGLPVINCFKRIHKESITNTTVTPLYQELDNTIADINKGNSDVLALENFAIRLREPIVTRFISILIQHIKKGDSNINSTLRLLGNECWEMRKNAARKIGEEASTRLLIPIMLMFGSILLIVIAPALMAFNSI